MTAALAQSPLVQQLTGNGELQWNDISSAFIQARSYTVEWAPRVGDSPPDWTALTTVPATNSAYRVEVPMVYRVRADLEARFPQLKLAVMSDLHYFDPSLLVQDGPAFQGYLATDPKLFRQSPAIIDRMMTEVKQAQPNLVLVTGDLTKDGELLNHQAMVGYLSQLEAGGAKVFVIPGNHDINNPDAQAYDGAIKSPVPTIAKADFASLYQQFGYGEAVARDPNSLSYVAEPVPGLWLLGIDSCHPERNTNGVPYVGGYLEADRLNWITNQLAAARQQGKFVIGMMHHGLIEHFPAQKALFPDYVVEDNERLAELFAGYGLGLVFTGHYHAQDVVAASFARGRIVEVETGSAVTFPCPYRLLTLQANGELVLTSHPITTIDADLGGVSFPTYASNFITAGVTGIATYMLINPPYNLPLPSAQFLAPAFAEGIASGYQGDEPTRPISPTTQGVLGYLQSQPDPASQMFAGILQGLFIDAAPPDNNLTINLVTGTTH